MSSPKNANVQLDEKSRAKSATVDKQKEIVNFFTEPQVLDKSTLVNVDGIILRTVNRSPGVKRNTGIPMNGSTWESVKRGLFIQMDENTLASLNGGTESEEDEDAFGIVNGSADTHIDDKTLRSANKSKEVTTDDNSNRDTDIQIDENTLDSMNRSTDIRIQETTNEAVNGHTDVQEDRNRVGSASRSIDVQVNSTTIATVNKCMNVKMDNKVESTKPRIGDKVDKNMMENVKKCTDGKMDKNTNSATDIQVDENRMGSVSRTIDFKDDEKVEETSKTDVKIEENNEETLNTDVKVDEHVETLKSVAKVDENVEETLNTDVKMFEDVEETLNTDVKLSQHVEETLNSEDTMQKHNLCDDIELDETTIEGENWCTNPIMGKNTVEGIDIYKGVVKVEDLAEDMNADQNIKDRQNLLENADFIKDVELENKTENINISAESRSGTDEMVQPKRCADVTLEVGITPLHKMENKDKDPVMFYDAIKPVFTVGSIIGLHTLIRKSDGKYTISPMKVFVATLGLTHSFLTLMAMSFVILTCSSYNTQVMLLPMQSGCSFCLHAYILCISKSKAIGKYLSAIEENQLKIKIPCPWFFLLGIFTYSIVYTACVLLVLHVPETHRIILLSPTLMTALIPSFVDVYVFSFVYAVGVGLEKLTKDVEEEADWTFQEVKAVADKWLQIDSLLRSHNAVSCSASCIICLCVYVSICLSLSIEQSVCVIYAYM